MINWIVEQQVILSLGLLCIITIEAKAVKSVGANAVYCLWLLIPLLLVANNLPQNVVTLDSTSVYQYVVSAGAQTQELTLSLNWGWLWGMGSITILSLGVYSQWRINHLTSEKINAQSLGFPIPKYLDIVTTKQLSGPVLSGIIKPKLFIPEGFQDHFTLRQQHLILAHELVHYHRRDNLYNLISLMFVAVFWFNPLTWLGYRAFRRSQELACDARVLRQSNLEDKITYSKALVLCAERSLHSFSIYSPYGEKHTMLKRISLIKSQTKIKPYLAGILIALCSTLVASVALAKLGKVEPTLDVSDAEPFIRIEPLYPTEAATNKQEGSVVLQFDITEDGSTDNIQVLESFPQQVFVKNSITALKQWKYKPKVQGGIAERQRGLQVQLDYRLHKRQENLSPSASNIEKVKVLQ